MTPQFVFRAKDVVGFSLDAENSWESRLLIDQKGVGADALVMTHFTIKAGKALGEAAAHPEPFDEVYYVLSGVGAVYIGDPLEKFEMRPGVVVFIPAGTKHRVENTGPDNLEFLTAMPGPLREGVNPVYDGRLKAWGKTFKLMDES